MGKRATLYDKFQKAKCELAEAQAVHVKKAGKLANAVKSHKNAAGAMQSAQEKFDATYRAYDQARGEDRQYVSAPPQRALTMPSHSTVVGGPPGEGGSGGGDRVAKAVNPAKERILITSHPELYAQGARNPMTPSAAVSLGYRAGNGELMGAQPRTPDDQPAGSASSASAASTDAAASAPRNAPPPGARVMG
jgi:hypothetical protein